MPYSYVTERRCCSCEAMQRQVTRTAYQIRQIINSWVKYEVAEDTVTPSEILTHYPWVEVQEDPIPNTYSKKTRS